ncbi:MAG: LysM peptidoglycan-binding domain-containing protein, partial [Acutalibacteraceae bacterium]
SFGILALDKEEKPFYFEDNAKIEMSFSVENENTEILSISPTIKSISYRISDEKSLEIRAEIEITGTTVTKNTKNVCGEFILKKDKPFEKISCPLTMYFGEKDENIWDIAKRYRTKVNLLKEENEIESDTLSESTMLFIRKV